MQISLRVDIITWRTRSDALFLTAGLLAEKRVFGNLRLQGAFHVHWKTPWD